MNSINIHNVVAVSVFRENGYLKLSTLDAGHVVTEVNLWSADNKPILLRDSADRIPCTPAEFGIVK